MAFSELAAFGTGMAAVVRVVACRFPVSKPMYYDSFASFLDVIIPFAAKKNRIRHLTMDFTIIGSLWHRVVVVVRGYSYRLNFGIQDDSMRENKSLFQLRQ